MKNILYILLLFPLLSMGQTTTQNYIKTLTYKDSTEVTDENKARVNVIYFDGLGRPVQQVAGKASPMGNDIITHIEYDAYNRQPKEYLSYVAGTNNLVFDTAAKSNTGVFYNKPKYENTPNPYSEQFFEASPLNRVLKTGAPGAVWRGNVDNNNDHTIKFDYQTNKPGEVRRFKVTFLDENNTERPQLAVSGYYFGYSLFKSITKDENWTTASGKCNTVEEFKDKLGRLILKRTYIKNSVNEDEPLDTYYVYDRFGNLTYVIPPLAVDQIVIRENVFSFAGRNYAWTKVLATDPVTTANYEADIASYPNSDILNIDSMAAYGVRGGFSLSGDESGNITLNLNVNTGTAKAYRIGEIASLDEFGTFADTELGRVSGSGYEYIFLIRNNAVVVTGSGLVPSVIKTMATGANLAYSKNYAWTAICNADAKVIADYNRDIAGLDNSQILNTFVPNPYNATGGLSVTLSEDNNLTLSANIISDVKMDLVSGAAFTLDIQRTISDMTLGTVLGDGYSYEFSVKSNVLYITGYGKFDQLNFTLSKTPIYSYTINEDAKRLCYIYHYDKRNRVVEKHIPDNGWTYIVYDQRNRPVFTQDENQRVFVTVTDANNRERTYNTWLFTEYDAFDRIAYTGVHETLLSPGQDALALRLNLQNYEYNRPEGDNRYSEARSSTGFVSSGITVYYTHSHIFSIEPPKNILTVNYYDAYDFDTKLETVGYLDGQPPSGNSYNSFAINKKGLGTGTKVRVLGTDTWLTNITAYDEKARPIWNWQHNPYLGITHGLQSNLDFTGRLLETLIQHKKGSTPTITVYDYYTYDDNSRMITHSQKIGNQTKELLTWNVYDELGQLKEKKVGEEAGLSYSNSGLQKIDYTYNIRGWLKTINNTDSMENDLFAFRLKHDDFGVYSIYNGNIVQAYWKTASDNIPRWYNYLYDAMDRLITGTFYENGAAEKYHEGNINYDKNGNIQALLRWGLKSNSTRGVIDELSYLYKPYSNQLLKVSDLGGAEGFKDGNTGSSNDYDYDVAGNMKKDLNKGITSITYNHLNLPLRITFNTNNYIEYTYNATGEKLRKQVKQNDVISATDYANGYVYQDGGLHYFPNPEGYTRKETNGSFSYIYQYKDHLGNVRLSYWKNGTALQIIEVADYYPFGMQHDREGNIVTSTNLGQKIKYNGKELQEELQLNVYDLEARLYDPAIGRFTTIDPEADEDEQMDKSPYGFAWNNPILLNDPDGRNPIKGWIQKMLKRYGDDGVKFVAKNSKGHYKPVSRIQAKTILQKGGSVTKTAGGSNKIAKKLMKEANPDSKLVRHDGHELTNLQGEKTGKTGLDHYQKKSGDGSHVFYKNAVKGLAVGGVASEASAQEPGRDTANKAAELGAKLTDNVENIGTKVFGNNDFGRFINEMNPFNVGAADVFKSMDETLNKKKTP